jgi:hypothetical protein
MNNEESRVCRVAVGLGSSFFVLLLHFHFHAGTLIVFTTLDDTARRQPGERAAAASRCDAR